MFKQELNDGFTAMTNVMSEVVSKMQDFDVLMEDFKKLLSDIEMFYGVKKDAKV